MVPVLCMDWKTLGYHREQEGRQQMVMAFTPFKSPCMGAQGEFHTSTSLARNASWAHEIQWTCKHTFTNLTSAEVSWLEIPLQQERDQWQDMLPNKWLLIYTAKVSFTPQAISCFLTSDIVKAKALLYCLYLSKTSHRLLELPRRKCVLQSWCCWLKSLRMTTNASCPWQFRGRHAVKPKSHPPGMHLFSARLPSPQQSLQIAPFCI